MVSKGAKNIVLVSRSGSTTGKVKQLIDELTLGGANIVVISLPMSWSRCLKLEVLSMAQWFFM
jgi:hypothetical protein